jgi:hypothetical protein
MHSSPTDPASVIVLIAGALALGILLSRGVNRYRSPGPPLRMQIGEETAFVESLVNALLTKRFSKKQSMQWTPEGAHLLLQIRTRTLNGDLAATFRQWYPALSLQDQGAGDNLLAA